MHDPQEYEHKYRRFVQGLISEEDFRRYLVLTLSKENLIEIVIESAKALRNAVSIGEILRFSSEHGNQRDSA